MANLFHVALTSDFYDAAGKPKYADLGLGVFEAQRHIKVSSLPEHRKVIGADQLTGVNGVVVLTPAVTKQTLSAAGDLLAVGRFGVGYDAVDVAACTEAEVLAFITAGAVDHSVAEAVVGWMLALTHHVRAKDELVRDCKWDQRSKYMGRELRDHVFGAVGLGGIARRTIRMLASFGMKPAIAFDPFAKEADAAALGIKLVSLDELLATADFVSIHCPLTEKTRGLIGTRELSRMKPTAYLINSARGGIVDEIALYDALAGGKLAGAALDCFAEEPVVKPIPLAELENVLLAPHCIAWTDELFRDIGQAVCRGMVDVSLGKTPRGLLNPELLTSPGFQKKWQRITGDKE